MGYTVTAINFCPVKSCGSTALQSAWVGARGIHGDRLWMAVDRRGMFVAQREDGGLGVEVKSICLIQPKLTEVAIILSAPDMVNFYLPIAGVGGRELDVQIWRDRVRAVDQGDVAASWVTEFLSRERRGEYRLVKMAQHYLRKTKSGEAELAFQDAHSLLIISQASLDDLNRRLSKPLPMDRFRPNIVIGDCEPYEEDHMARLQIGPVELEGQNLCVRCATTATNQQTAARGKEPLTTLATYRRNPHGKGVVFGRNFDHLTFGEIQVGDAVEVLARD